VREGAGPAPPRVPERCHVFWVVRSPSVVLDQDILHVHRPDGTLFGEGHGVLTGQGGESATWIGSGVGRMTGKGSAAIWRGAVYYQTASPKWARLNGVAAVFEYETDEHGNTTAKLWEWK